jgi:hypothetical protein
VFELKQANLDALVGIQAGVENAQSTADKDVEGMCAQPGTSPLGLDFDELVGGAMDPEPAPTSEAVTQGVEEKSSISGTSPLRPDLDALVGGAVDHKQVPITDAGKVDLQKLLQDRSASDEHDLQNTLSSLNLAATDPMDPMEHSGKDVVTRAAPTASKGLQAFASDIEKKPPAPIASMQSAKERAKCQPQKKKPAQKKAKVPKASFKRASKNLAKASAARIKTKSKGQAVKASTTGEKRCRIKTKSKGGRPKKQPATTEDEFDTALAKAETDIKDKEDEANARDDDLSDIDKADGDTNGAPTKGGGTGFAFFSICCLHNNKSEGWGWVPVEPATRPPATRYNIIWYNII